MWEITSIDILPMETNALAKLNKLAGEGWEPYAVDNYTHWFKRASPGPSPKDREVLPESDVVESGTPPATKKNKKDK